MNVEKVFENVTGRKMNPDEVTRYLKFQKEFEVPDTDPTWMIFVWFEFYQRIFEQFPSSARAEAEAATRQVKEASAVVIRSAAAEIDKAQSDAKIEINKMTTKTKEEIGKALSGAMNEAVSTALDQITQSVVVQASKSQARKWLAIGGGVMLITVLLTAACAWYYFSTQITKAKENTPMSLSLECNRPGEEIYKIDGQRLCVRHLPPK